MKRLLVWSLVLSLMLLVSVGGYLLPRRVPYYSIGDGAVTTTAYKMGPVLVIVTTVCDHTTDVDVRTSFLE